MRKILTVFLVLLLITCSVHAKETALSFRKGTSVFQFLKIGVGTRALGLGEAFIGLADDSTSIFWNPSGLANIENKYDVQFNHSSYLVDTSYEFMTFAMTTPDLGTFGFALKYFDYGDFDYTIPYGYKEDPGESGETFTGYDYVATVSWGKRLTDNFALGLNYNYIYEEIEKSEIDSFSLDLGITYSNADYLKDFKIAFVIQNMGQTVQYIKEGERYNLPFCARFGFGWLPWESYPHKLLLGVDFIQFRDADLRANMGLEYSLRDFIFVRTGLQTGYDIANVGVSAGFGIKSDMMQMMTVNADIAYTMIDDFDDLIRIGFGVSF